MDLFFSDFSVKWFLLGVFVAIATPTALLLILAGLVSHMDFRA